MVLLIVDTQKLITNTSLYSFTMFVSNVKKLIKEARENKVEVIYIRHDNEFMWKGRYADCISIEETLGLLSNI